MCHFWICQRFVQCLHLILHSEVGTMCHGSLRLDVHVVGFTSLYPNGRQKIAALSNLLIWQCVSNQRGPTADLTAFFPSNSLASLHLSPVFITYD